ncbi:MAG TPA: DNA recombination protein RmuC [Caulobacteraceae bacterium]|nr:DNA recombination protein RmuC [Caulobacteraceae bacterium]
MNAFELVILCLSAVAVVALCGFLGALKALMRERSRSAGLDRDLAAAHERTRQLEATREEANVLLRAQAAESAGVVAEQLVARAHETFQNQQALAQTQLEGQLKPVAEVLQKFEQQVQAIETRRAEETGRLKEQISQLMRASQETQFETRKLSAALRRGAGVQGRWGEQTLRNVLEAAGLNHRFDFDEQSSVDTEEGRRRPDVTVKMPGGGVFVIDAKCSLNAFLEAQEAADEPAREAALLRHAQSVKTHMTSLSAKAYWDQFDSSPDFVAMFVPGDGFLAPVLDRMPDLMTEAMDRRVILVTPTTLFALCKAVAYGWRVEDQAKGAAKTAELGRELYKRLSVMGGHASALGKALESAVGRYNSFVGSLESQVMTQARRFEDLAVDHEGKELPELGPVETAVRPLSKLAAPADQPLPAPEASAVN